MSVSERLPTNKCRLHICEHTRPCVFLWYHMKHEQILHISEMQYIFCCYISILYVQNTFLIGNYKIGNQFGTTSWCEEFSERGQIFKLCPIVSKHVQHIFPGMAKIFLGSSPPLRPFGCGPGNCSCSSCKASVCTNDLGHRTSW